MVPVTIIRYGYIWCNTSYRVKNLFGVSVVMIYDMVFSQVIRSDLVCTVLRSWFSFFSATKWHSLPPVANLSPLCWQIRPWQDYISTLSADIYFKPIFSANINMISEFYRYSLLVIAILGEFNQFIRGADIHTEPAISFSRVSRARNSSQSVQFNFHETIMVHHGQPLNFLVGKLINGKLDWAPTYFAFPILIIWGRRK